MTDFVSMTENEIRDEVLSLRRQYHEETVGCRRRLYQTLARAAAITIEITKNPGLWASLNLPGLIMGQDEFAARMAAALHDTRTSKLPRRVRRHAAMVSHLVKRMGKLPTELPTELRTGIGKLARDAAIAKRKARERRLAREAIREWRLGLSEADIRRMAASRPCSLVKLVLSRQNNTAYPFRVEKVRYSAVRARS